MAEADPKIVVTDEMVAVGRDLILRELTMPDREDIGPYTAARVAKAVFQEMLAKSDPESAG